MNEAVTLSVPLPPMLLSSVAAPSVGSAKGRNPAAPQVQERIAPSAPAHQPMPFLPLFQRSSALSGSFSLLPVAAQGALRAPSGDRTLPSIVPQPQPAQRSVGEAVLDLIFPRAEAFVPVVLPAVLAAEEAVGVAVAAGAVGAAAVLLPRLQRTLEGVREAEEIARHSGGFPIIDPDPRPYLGPRPEEGRWLRSRTTLPAHPREANEGTYVNPITTFPEMLIMYRGNRNGNGNREREETTQGGVWAGRLRPRVLDAHPQDATIPRHPGPYAPNRELPVDHGVGIPDPEAEGRPHTQLGTKVSMSKTKKYSYTKAREFNAQGEAVRDIEFTDHNRRDHTNPHQHRWVPNKTGGTLKRGDGEPLELSSKKASEATQSPAMSLRPRK